MTLMELIVVMAIISMLSGLLISGVMAALRRKGVGVTKAFITRLDLAIRQYETDYGDFPNGAGGISSAEALRRALGSPSWRGQQEFEKSEAADTDDDGKLEVVDYWGRPLSYFHHRCYSGPPRAASFRLISAGLDGEEGTADDIKNFE